MFRQMRRIKQQLSEEESIQILKDEKRGFLSVLGENDYPYGIPMNYVFTDNKIIFHSALEGHKIDSIRKQNKVSFTVITDGNQVENEWYYIFKSVIVFGKIRFIEDEAEKIKQLTLLGNKYFPSKEYTEDEINKYLKKTNVLELDIEHITGKVVTEK